MLRLPANTTQSPRANQHLCHSIEEIEDTEGDEVLMRFRTAVLGVPDATALTAIPCGCCPVMDQCHDGGQISPQTCVYYTSWLEF